MSVSEPETLFLVVADNGGSVEVDETEVYVTVDYAWQQADELQAEADSDGDAVVYVVYRATAVERQATA